MNKLKRLLVMSLIISLLITPMGSIAYGAENPDGNQKVTESLKTYYGEESNEFMPDANSENREQNGVTFKEHKGDVHVDGFRKELEPLKPVEEEQGISDNQKVKAIIVLDEKSLLERGYEASEIEESFWADVTTSRMNKKQDKVAEKAENTCDDVKVEYYYTIGTCGIAITTPYKNIEKIKKIRGVKDVILSPLYEVPEADDTNTINGASAVWGESGYTGKGSKIAVIDTGLDLQHPGFSGDNFQTTKTSLTKNKINEVLDGLNASVRVGNLSADKLYRSAKVPFAFNYIDASLRVDHDDANGSDHGTHVAGIAAANRQNETGVCGVAPDAQVLVMKVFGNRGGAYFNDILAALEDSVRLGCDSVNISVGVSAGFTEDEEVIDSIFSKICDTDVIVSVAAGNDYNAAFGNPNGTNANLTSNPDNGILSSPGTYLSSTTVASIDNASEFFTVDKKNFGFNDSAQTDETKFLKNFIQGKTYDFALVGNYGATTADFEKAGVKGKIALVSRGGGITFMDKQKNAQQAGAIGVMVYNNVDGTSAMKIHDGKGNIPCISISKTAGEYMADRYKNGVTTITIGVGKINENIGISSFSSWGCTSSLNLKPDITAVGGNVLSTTNGGSYGTKSGTSMASPQIAGASALVKQYLREKEPGLSAGAVHERINQLLMSTAIPYKDSNGIEFSPRRQGAGVISVNDAINTEAYLSVNGQEGNRPKAELFDDPSKTGKYNFSFNVTNSTADSLAYSMNNSLFTNGYVTQKDEAGNEMNLMGESPAALDGKSELKSKDMGYYYDITGDKEVDTRDIRALMVKEKYSNREEAMADINKDGVECDGKDIQNYLDNLTGVNKDVDLNEEVLIVPGNSTSTVDVSLTLTEEQKKKLDTIFPNGIYVEGYSYLVSRNADGINLSLPYMGFYGSWTQAPAFDADDYFYKKEGQINSYGTYMWTEESILGVNPYVESEYKSEHNAISETNVLDVFETGLLRNVKSMDYEVTDSKNQVIYDEHEKYVSKSMYKAGGNTFKFYRSPRLWDGKGSDGEFLENNEKVNLKITATFDYKDGKQIKEYPITVDTENPELLKTETVVRDGRTILKASFRDNQYISAVIFKSANGSIELDRYGFDQKKAGETVKDFEFDVTDYDDDFMMIICDYATNQMDYDINMGVKDNGLKEPTPLDKDRIYGFNMGEATAPGEGVVSALKKDASDARAEIDMNGIDAAEYIDGYVIAVNALKELSVYTPQGRVWSQKKICDINCDVYDMAFNHKDGKLYAITFKNNKAYLSTIDIFDGTIKDIGAFGRTMVTMGCTTDGSLYTISKAGELCNINKETAEVKVVGKVSETETDKWVTLNYRQSMAYDHNDQVMYWYVFSANKDTGKIISHLAKVDLATAKTEVVGKFGENCEVTGLFVPYDGNLTIEGTKDVTGVTLNESSVALYPGQEVRVFAAVTPWNTDMNEIEWTSDNENIAVVSNGRIRATGSGETVIHAKVKGTEFSASCTVKILETPDPFYGYMLTDWHGDPGNNIISFKAENPIKYRRVKEALEFVYAGEYLDGYYYCYDSNGYLYKFDTKNWDYKMIGKADGRIVEMTYDYADHIMYGLLSNGHQTTLVEVDINTGETTDIGSQDTKVVAMTSVPDSALNAEGKFESATLYGINEKSELVTLDKKDGHATKDPASDKYELPPVSYVQSMTYDYNTGYIYWAQVYKPQASSLYVLDLNAETKYYAGVIGRVGSQVSGLYTVPREGTVPEIPYTSLKDLQMSTEDCVMVKGNKMKIKVKTVPANATNRAFEWSTNAPDIADVNAGGEVTANNEGTAVITCKVKDENTIIEKSVKVTVTRAIPELKGFLMLDNHDNSHNAWININPNRTEEYELLHNSKPTISAGTYYDGYLYGYDNDYETSSGQRNFYKINEKTGSTEKLGSITHDVSDMTFDYNTGIMYAISDDKNISIVDPVSGELETVFEQSDQILVTIAADKNGVLYVIARDKADTKDGWATLYTVDLKNGKLNKVGETGQKAVLEQSMIFDYDTGYIYWSQISGSKDAKLYIVNPANGYASPIGKIGKNGAEVSALYSTVNEPEVPHVDLAGIKIKQGKNAVIAVDSQLKLNASAVPVYASNRNFTYTSENEKIAKVSKDGTVTGVGSGETDIVVSAEEKGKVMESRITIKVILPPENMEAFLIRDHFTDAKDQFIRFSMTDSENYEVTKKFDKTIVAADRYNGFIYAYTLDNDFIKINEKTKEYEVISHIPERMDDLAFNPVKGIMYGKTYIGNKLVQININDGTMYTVGVVRDEKGEREDVSAIAATDQGVLYGMSHGGRLFTIDETGVATLVSETGLTVKAGHECDLTFDPDTKLLYYSQSSALEQVLYMIDPVTTTVIEMYPVGDTGSQISLLYANSRTKVPVPEKIDSEAIVLSNDVAKLAVGGRLKLTSTVLPVSVALSQGVTWKSENPEVATVDKDGNVTGIKNGKAEIIATSLDGKSTASCMVTVGGKMMYGYSHTHGAWVSYAPDHPETMTELAKGEEVDCAANVDGTVYAYLKGGKQLVKFDFANKDFTYQKIGTAQRYGIKSIAYDPVGRKLYGITMNKMYEINMETGAQTQLSSKPYFGKPGMMLYTMACNSEGNIYAISSLGTLCTLDQTTGLGEFVKNNKNYPVDGANGSLNGNYNPMAFDKDGNLYWAATTRKNVKSTILKIIDLQTALTKETIGSFGGGEVKMTSIFFDK